MKRTLSIFWAFLGAGMVSFGGAMPHVQRLVVEKKKWMDSAEFAETVGLCQFVPGPNATNVSICVGQSLSGVPGAVAAAAGLLFFPICFAMAAAALFAAYSDSETLARVAHGMALAGSGLLFSAAIKLFQGIKADRMRAYATAGLVLLAVGAFNVPLLAAIAAVAAAAAAGAWIQSKRKRDGAA